MLNKKWMMFLFAGVLILSQAHAQDHTADRAQIIANEKAWADSFVTGDPTKLADFIAADFQGVNSDGFHYGRNEELEAVRTSTRNTKADIKVLSIDFFGDLAITHVQEHDTSAAPEFRPLNSITSDVWVKRNGNWLAVSGMDMDMGFLTPPAYSEDEKSIRKLRDENNKKLAARDLDSFASLYDEQALFTWSDGSSAMGREGLKKDFAERFKNTNWKTYIRSPETVHVAEDGQRAVEQGHWVGLFQGKSVGGDYMAHWEHTIKGWSVRGEVYTRLYCAGAECGK